MQFSRRGGHSAQGLTFVLGFRTVLLWCKILNVSTVTEIRDAIRKLPPQEAWRLAEELRDYLDALWDKQFEEDVKAGRLDALIGRAREEYASGKTRSMDEIIGDEWILAALSRVARISQTSGETHISLVERRSADAVADLTL